MNILIIGTPDSGKSAFAEKLAVEISGGGPKKYIATMVPFGKEGAARVAKHRNMRAGKGFDTIECPLRVDLLNPGNTTCLLECMSNLIGNEMHAEENVGKNEQWLTDTICREVKCLSDKVINLIVVSNEFSQEDDGYDFDTEKYVRLVSRVNTGLIEFMDKVYIKQNGDWVIEKSI